jgi:hypothetical protein
MVVVAVGSAHPHAIVRAETAAAAEVDLDAPTKALVERLVLDRAASLAAVQRRADERERILLAQLAQKDKSLRSQRSQTAAVQQELESVTAERQRLVREIENRDTQFKAELAEYRRAIVGLASSPSQERRAALERYADGDRVGAFSVLEELTRIEAEARARAALRVASLESAKSFRELATLAEDMKDRGEKTTAEVLKIWSQAASLDPDDFWTWVNLARLHAESGGTGEAMRAARESIRVAADDREKSVALSELGDVQVAAGDLAGARQSFEESHQILARLAAANPTSAAAQRDVAVSLWKLASLPNGPVRWSDVAEALRGMQARGVLGPQDVQFLEEAERRAALQR